jgi:hypothetical protein
MLAPAFCVVPDKTPEIPPLGLIAGPQVAHSPVHLPLVLQLTEPAPVLQLKPESLLSKAPPALLHLVMRLDWDIEGRSTLSAQAAPVKKLGVAKATRVMAIAKLRGFVRTITVNMFLTCCWLNAYRNALRHSAPE